MTAGAQGGHDAGRTDGPRTVASRAQRGDPLGVDKPFLLPEPQGGGPYAECFRELRDRHEFVAVLAALLGLDRTERPLRAQCFPAFTREPDVDLSDRGGRRLGWSRPQPCEQLPGLDGPDGTGESPVGTQGEHMRVRVAAVAVVRAGGRREDADRSRSRTCCTE